MSKETGARANEVIDPLDVKGLMALLQECLQGTQQLTSDVQALTGDVQTITGRVNAIASAINDRTQEATVHVQTPTDRIETSDWHPEDLPPYVGALRPKTLKELGLTRKPVLFAPREGYHSGRGYSQQLVGPSGWKAGD